MMITRIDKDLLKYKDIYISAYEEIDIQEASEDSESGMANGLLTISKNDVEFDIEILFDFDIDIEYDGGETPQWIDYEHYQFVPYTYIDSVECKNIKVEQQISEKNFQHLQKQLGLEKNETKELIEESLKLLMPYYIKLINAELEIWFEV